jgi:predicted dinucleotide-binding enzyme
MKIGVLGSGIVGRILGAGFAKYGHDVKLGTRNPQSEEARKWVTATPRASSGTFAESAQFGEYLVLAVAGRNVESAIDLAGAVNFANKTLLDATNPIAATPPVNGVLTFFTGPNESLGEKIQSLLPQARVVKAYNSVGNALMVNPHFDQGTPTMFICGDDAAAKAQVSDTIRQFGWEPFDCGGIVASRSIEPLCMLWCIPGLQHNQWNHAFKLLTH